MFGNQKIYFCDDGGSCFVCVGRDICTNYRTTPLSSIDQSERVLQLNKPEDIKLIEDYIKSIDEEVYKSLGVSEKYLNKVIK